MANITQEIEKLAAEIGENIYIDVANWHLYLANAHLHTTVAQKAFPLLENNDLNQTEVEQILRSIPVKLGGGKKEVSLLDLLPEKCFKNLLDLLEEYQKNL
jgi:hypothetical protein